MTRSDLSIVISDERERLDRELIHRFLSEESYWAKGIPREIVDRAIDGSHCFGAYADDRQVGFTRVITDHATFGYLSDVFVISEFRGRGVGRQLVETALAHPELRTLRRWMLVTQDAQSLYARYGFENPPHPEWIMQISRRGMYLPPTEE